MSFMTLQGGTLKEKLSVISYLIFGLPVATAVYLLHDKDISFDLRNAAIIALSLLVALGGFLLLRRVFEEVAGIAVSLKIRTDNELTGGISAAAGTKELKVIADSFNTMLKRLESQTVELGALTEDKKKARAALNLLEKAVNTTKTGITVTDLNHKIIYINPSDAEMHGYSVDELMGRDVRVFASETDFGLMTQEQISMLKTWARDSINIKKDGTAFPVHLISDAVKDDSGNIIGIVTTCEDITDRMEAEKSLKETQAMMFHTSRLSKLGEMAAAVAHEINQPLNVIGLACQSLLLDEQEGIISPIEPKISRKLELIEKQVFRISKIIDHLRMFARKDSSGADRKLVNANELPEGVLTLIGEQLRLRDIEIIRAYESGLPMVLVNRQRIDQVLFNLISNAKDAMADRPVDIKRVLKIATKKDNDSMVSIEVSDTGGGISDLNRGKIFEPFFTTKDIGKGTGLGLSISFGIAKEHGGDLSCEVHQDIGCTFRLTLPSTGQYDGQ